MKTLAPAIAIRLAVAVMALAGLSNLAACDGGEPAANGTSNTSEADRRANGARGAQKADAPGTCADSCGEQGAGGCWCDDSCDKYGDCCADKAALCEEAPVCSDVMCKMACQHGFKKDDAGCEVCACAPAPDSCEGVCGGKSETGCWCDAECAKYGDCCDDKAEVCDAPTPCHTGGCSGQLCTDQPDMISTCEYLPEYACYKKPTTFCERQDNGSCGWTNTPELQECLVQVSCKPVLCEQACAYGYAQDEDGCQTCECAAPICPPVALPNPAACPDGSWEPTYDEGGECIVGFECVADNNCFATGCGATMCSDTEVLNIWCPQDDVYACYEQDFAECKPQANGECGWTKNAELDQCVDNGGICGQVMCKMYCQYGWATDPETGCEICGCAEAPLCQPLLTCKIDCPNGLAQDENGCDECACAPLVCEPLTCKMDCPNGLAEDDNGCNICACAPPVCEALACKMDCPFGLVRDDNGCDQCACAEPVGCQAACGDKSDDGCWCDDSCEAYGDCCDNKADVCQ